jgi:xylulokinase
MSLLLSVDLGTTGCKAAVYDEKGSCLGESYLEYDLITVSDTVIEQDPQAWWQLSCEAIRLALRSADLRGRLPCALAVTSQGISFVLVDDAGLPLGNAINWLDTRATAECAEILRHYTPEDLFAITGKRVSPAYVLPKLLWVRSHLPDSWKKVHRVLMAHDYLVYRLCGRYVTDHSLAGGTLLYDLRASDWCTELLGTFGIPSEMLPTLCWSGTPVGSLRSDVAGELGLKENTVVVVGGQDQKCAALGAGIRNGVATVSLGTATAISQLIDRPLTDSLMRVPTFSFVQKDRWVLEGVISTGAGSLRWLRDILNGDLAYDGLMEEAARVAIGANGVMFYPHLSGAGSPHWRESARATFYGLSLATDRAHLTRALIEGVAFEIRENLAAMQELAGSAHQLIVFGGGAKSALWRQIIADVTNKPVALVSSVETASLGAAMLAGVGVGRFRSLDEAQQGFVHTLAFHHPCRESAELYDRLYIQYCAVEERLLCR